MSFFLLPTLLASLIAKASPVSVKTCEAAGVDLRSIVQPIQQNSVSMYGGKVIAYNVDVVDPGCCARGVAIVLPDVLSPLGDTKCVAVVGFYGANVMQAIQTYSPALGFLLNVPVTRYTPQGSPKRERLKLRINLRDSSVVIE